jgi:hypothetical protein
MDDKYGIVVFDVTEDAEGLFTATSPQLPGVCVVHRDLDRIIEDMPDIMRLWFRRNRGMEITVYKGPSKRRDRTLKISAIPVPAEIAAQALAR